MSSRSCDDEKERCMPEWRGTVSVVILASYAQDRAWKGRLTCLLFSAIFRRSASFYVQLSSYHTTKSAINYVGSRISIQWLTLVPLLPTHSLALLVQHYKCRLLPSRQCSGLHSSTLRADPTLVPPIREFIHHRVNRYMGGTSLGYTNPAQFDQPSMLHLKHMVNGFGPGLSQLAGTLTDERRSKARTDLISYLDRHTDGVSRDQSRIRADSFLGSLKSALQSSASVPENHHDVGSAATKNGEKGGSSGDSSLVDDYLEGLSRRARQRELARLRDLGRTLRENDHDQTSNSDSDEDYYAARKAVEQELKNGKSTRKSKRPRRHRRRRASSSSSSCPDEEVRDSASEMAWAGLAGFAGGLLASACTTPAPLYVVDPPTLRTTRVQNTYRPVLANRRVVRRYR
jgi:hypothetical protein